MFFFLLFYYYFKSLQQFVFKNITFYFEFNIKRKVLIKNIKKTKHIIIVIIVIL
jgi:hypothetical protein